MSSSRLLDLLLDVNNCPQIPPDKRIDLSLGPPASEEEFSLDIDRPSTPSSPKNGTKSYKNLLSEVPHFGFASAGGRLQEMAINDLNTGRDSPADPLQGAPHPPTFLTADDIDNYVYHIDVRLAARQRDSSPATDFLPTLAPLAGTRGQPPDKSTPPSALLQALQTAAQSHSLRHASAPSTSASAARDLAVRNPTSVYNWLRKHAPNTFLQDHEVSATDHAAASEDAPAKGVGGSRGSRAGAAAAADKGDRARPSAARSRKQPGAGPSRGGGARSRDAEAMDLDDDQQNADLPLTPAEKKAAGSAASSKRKRVVDDDPGYRPKGGSSRPKAAKKRKSIVAAGGAGGEEAGPPPAKKARKSAAAAAKVEERREGEDEGGDGGEGEVVVEEEERDAITARGQEED